MGRAGRMKVKAPLDATDWGQMQPQTQPKAQPEPQPQPQAKPRQKNEAEGAKPAGDKLDLTRLLRGDIKAEDKKKGRGEARRLRRQRQRINEKHCFGCREAGHTLAECPKRSQRGGCLKCGSTSHPTARCKMQTSEFAHAVCFVCEEKGHLAKDCPKNANGLYPQGGGCRRCGSKLHHMQDCTRSRREAEAAAEGTAEAAAGGGKRIRLPMASAATSADAEDDEAFYALERASDDEEEELKKEIPISRPLPAKVAKTSRQVKIVKF